MTRDKAIARKAKEVAFLKRVHRDQAAAEIAAEPLDHWAMRTGVLIENPNRICPSCHKVEKRGAAACRKCGTRLREMTAADERRLQAEARRRQPPRRNAPERKRNLFGFGGGRKVVTADEVREMQRESADSLCRHGQYRDAQRTAKQAPRRFARDHNLQIEGARHRVARKIRGGAAKRLGAWAKRLEGNPDRVTGQLHYFGAYGDVPVAWYHLTAPALESLRNALLDPNFYAKESPDAPPGRADADLNALVRAIDEAKVYGSEIFVAHDRRGWYVARQDEPAVENPESRFEKLERRIAARGDAYDPYAVAAAIGIRKYGKKRFEQMAQAGRRRAARRRHERNPGGDWQDTLGIPPWLHSERDRRFALEIVSSLERDARAQGVRGIDFAGWRRRIRAARLIPRLNPEGGDPASDAELERAAGVFEKFQGRKPREVLELQRGDVQRSEFAKLGDLVSLTVRGRDDKDYKLDFGPQDEVIVASSANAKQLYVLGGNQDVRPLLEELGADGGKDFVELGPCVQIEYFTHKRLDQFQPIRYYHKFGEETGDVPVLVFDQLNVQLLLVGGAYEVKPEGIVN